MNPLANIEPRYHQGWLEQAEKILVRRRELDRLYDAIEASRHDGALFSFSELSRKKLPKKGVYVFIDPAESSFRGDPFRIVRIGTHAVSEGSKSTLKARLRNHLGQSDGSGSHRGSIFRLHVGRAMLAKSNSFESLSSWGEGQHASREIRAAEIAHERLVSAYMRKLEVLIIPADDASSKHSIRSDIERQLIAVCSEHFQCLDQPDENWLGYHSPVDAIRKSGLWNIRDVASVYDANARGCVSDVVDLLEAS